MAIADLRTITTPPATGTRDTGIDLVRALCVVGVVVIHALMVGVTVTDAGPLFENASDGSMWIAPLSWLLQVMPLFFVIAGFAGYTSFVRSRNRGGTASSFVAARIHRLVLPAVWTVGIVTVGLTALLAYGVPEDLVGIAGFRFGQPLWFLGVFLLCQVLLPALVRAHERAPWGTITLLAAAAVAVDGVRIFTGVDGLGFFNLAFVWLALQQLGFFLADGRIGALTRRTRTVLALTAAGGLVLTVATGVYSPDLIENINPPTTALFFVGVAHTMLMSLLRERLNAWSRMPLGARLRGFITPRAMTIYLWHMPVLLVMAGASALFALITGFALPEPSSPEWWMTRPLWLAIAFTLTALVAWALARIEARPAPRATRSTVHLTASAALGIAAIAVLLVLGATPLTGALAVVVMILALRLARTRFSRVRPHGRAGALAAQPAAAR
jgi:peptidoglycan/LPS O-acetylase OafA/YrhL